jgi:acyl-CoA oxidase
MARRAGASIECGEKLGLNGVDNGRLSFDSVRIPRENLLDLYATVDSSIATTAKSPAARGASSR